jgi:hypothetical protein
MIIFWLICLEKGRKEIEKNKNESKNLVSIHLEEVKGERERERERERKGREENITGVFSALRKRHQFIVSMAK